MTNEIFQEAESMGVPYIEATDVEGGHSGENFLQREGVPKVSRVSNCPLSNLIEEKERGLPYSIQLREPQIH